MKQYFFVKPMATDLYITVSQRGEPIEVMTPDMDGYIVLTLWRIDVAAGETPLLHKMILLPETASEHDMMTMVDTIIGIEFTQGMVAVRKFETNEEGDF